MEPRTAEEWIAKYGRPAAAGNPFPGLSSDDITKFLAGPGPDQSPIPLASPQDLAGQGFGGILAGAGSAPAPAAGPPVFSMPSSLPAAAPVQANPLPAPERSAFSPSAELDLSKPLPPSSGSSAKPDPFASAGPAPFGERFVNTGPVPGVGLGRFVKSRDDELAAMAEGVANRTAAGLRGTGLGASGNYYDPNGAAFDLHAAGLGQGAADAFLKSAGGLEQNASQERIAATQGAAHVAGAQAAHSPEAVRGQAMVELSRALATGNVNPDNLKMAMDFIGSVQHGGVPAGTPAGAAPAAPGAAADPLGGLRQVKAGRDATVSALSALGGVNAQGVFEQSKDLGIKQLEDLADRISGMPDDQRAAVVKSIMENKAGDRQAVMNAAAKAFARNAYLAGGNPTDLRATNPRDIPGSVTLPYGDRPIVSLGVKPTGNFPLGNKLSVVPSAGLPWDQLTIQGGGTIPFSPQDIAGLGQAITGRPINKDEATRRSQMLGEMLGVMFPQQQPQRR